MKIQSFSIVEPLKNRHKQHAIYGNSERSTWPIVYLQRPSHITDDEVWLTIVQSIRLELPRGFEIK